MSHNQTAWVDIGRCTGCGVCGDVCPVAAITIVNGRACVDEAECTGCHTCVDACPEGAILPQTHGEVVAVQEWPAPVVQRSKPLAETAGVAVAAAGVGVLAKVGGALTRVLGRWLARELAGRRERAPTESSPRRGISVRFASRTDGRTLRLPPRAGRKLSQLLSEREAGCAGAAPTVPPTGGGAAAGRRQARRRHRGR